MYFNHRYQVQNHLLNVLSVTWGNVEIKDGRWISKKRTVVLLLARAYIKEPFSPPTQALLFPPTIFVMGYRNHSIDSRYGWLVSVTK